MFMGTIQYMSVYGCVCVCVCVCVLQPSVRHVCLLVCTCEVQLYTTAKRE